MVDTDFKNVITKYKDDLINDIEKTLSEYGQWPNAAGIQTLPKLFENTGKHWQVVKESFIEACSKKPDKVISWAYIQRPGIENPNYPGWHAHGEYRKDGMASDCGVMYLDRFEEGTMFKKGSKEIIGDPTPFVWHMFSPLDVHCPPKWDPTSGITRYVIAADAIRHHFRSSSTFWEI
jgi:hypothetical protein